MLHGIPIFSIAWDFVKRIVGSFPGAWNKFVFRRFLGEGVGSDQAYFVIDTYEDPRPRSPFRYVKHYPRRKGSQMLFGGNIIYGTFSPNAAALLTAVFLKHTGKLLRIATDTDLDQKMDASMICYGSSDSNLKTFDIEASPENSFYKFVFEPSTGQRAFQLAGTLHTIESRNGITYDKAVLLKATYQQNSIHSYVVCAGLSEWGSLAAVHYFGRNWKALHKRFKRFWKRKDFCLVLEVQYGQFENAREVDFASQE